MKPATFCELDKHKFPEPQPSGGTNPIMKSNHAYLQDLFATTTRRDAIKVLTDWLAERGEISNLDSRMKNDLIRFKERNGIL